MKELHIACLEAEVVLCGCLLASETWQGNIIQPVKHLARGLFHLILYKLWENQASSLVNKKGPTRFQMK